jgi:NAD+ synthase (glutamine-hydrolysing)
MRLVNIALCSLNTTVGAVRTNLAKLLTSARAAAAAGATVAVFPEQTLSGYAPEDLVQWRAFVAAQANGLLELAAATRDMATVFAVGATIAREAHVYNSAVIIHRGQILGVVPKEKLPTYNVFYEARTFARGIAGERASVKLGEQDVPFGDLVFEFDFGVLAAEVCEDMWSPDGPMRRRCYGGAELVLNLSASPFRVGIDDTRREMIATRAADNQATVAYVNLVGANDGLVFDGGGYVSQNGRLVHESPRFVEQIAYAVVDLDRTRRLRGENTTYRMDQQEFLASGRQAHRLRCTGVAVSSSAHRYPVPRNGSFFLPNDDVYVSRRSKFCEEILDALALGVGDYFDKTGAFKTIGVALSGGRDSLLCLIIARRFLDRKYAALSPVERDLKAAEVLRAFFMPTRYSSAETRAAAIGAARELCAPLAIVSVDDAFERELLEVEKMLQPGESITGLARQNAQARVRAERMWTWSNAASGLFLQTSNMSEKAVGYTTIGGDMEGAFSVIANVPKTVVNYLLNYLQETTKSEGIRLTLLKPASAELADNQEDEKDLMPFPVLDACFALYAGEKMSPGEVAHVLAAMFPAEPLEVVRAWAARFARLFTMSIYKWVQTPLAIHIGNLDLDRERALQLPVVQRSEWHD